jgi:hypothetical protein
MTWWRLFGASRTRSLIFKALRFDLGSVTLNPRLFRQILLWSFGMCFLRDAGEEQVKKGRVA